MERAPLLAIWPGLSLAIVVFGINMFGDALRDLLDPRLSGGAGRIGAANVKQAREAPGGREHGLARTDRR
jgi:peptide/nickel transport system permease protein